MKYEIDVLDEELSYDGFFQLKTFRLKHSLYAGGWSKEIVRERVERRHAVSILLYDPLLDNVVMIEQFRIGALEASEGAWILEVIGGLVEEGESVDDVAQRECLEEAGCEILDTKTICEFYASPGTATEKITLLCAKVDSSSAGGIFGLEEEGEDIRAEVLTADQAIAELNGGRVNSTSAIIAVQWLAMNKAGLVKAWG